MWSGWRLDCDFKPTGDSMLGPRLSKLICKKGLFNMSLLLAIVWVSNVLSSLCKRRPLFPIVVICTAAWGVISTNIASVLGPGHIWRRATHCVHAGSFSSHYRWIISSRYIKSWQHGAWSIQYLNLTLATNLTTSTTAAPTDHDAYQKAITNYLRCLVYLLDISPVPHVVGSNTKDGPLQSKHTFYIL